jgi:hypothetical protein
LYKYKHGQFHERTDEDQKQPHLDYRLDDEELPTSVFKEGSLYMQHWHSSVNCPGIHFAQILWQCFSSGDIAYQRNLGIMCLTTGT